MLDLKNALMKRYQYLEKLESETEKHLSTFPEGSLWLGRSNGRTQYYYKRNESDKKGRYLSVHETNLIRQLAQKDYDKRLLCALRQEMMAIRKFQKNYLEVPAERVYEKLSRQRQLLVKPGIETEEMFAENWNSVEYKGKSFSSNDPDFTTELGERVRSKSELIIANMLAKMKIPYRYEYPVTLRDYGTIYPDFTVLNRRLRKEMYWEHLGMMDDPGYAEKAVRKLTIYNLNGYFQGDRLIVTAETKLSPVNIKQLQLVVEEYLL